MGIIWTKKKKYLRDNPTQNIKAISLVVSGKKIFKVFEIYFYRCDLDILFHQLFERAILGPFLSAKFDQIQPFFRMRYHLKQLLTTYDGQRTSNDQNSSLWAYDSGGLIKYTKYCDFKYVYLTLTLDI